MPPLDDQTLAAAARAVSSAGALLIAAGAGMGVDSGLPDFRGGAGFWRAYPAFERLGLQFEELANPHWFARDPNLAWGFYGHRLNLYRATVPHEGFAILHRWAADKAAGAYIFTSNVDGQFQKAGFSHDGIVECHGSIHHMQCARRCHEAVWSANAEQVVVDEHTMRAADPLPRCPSCGGIARPNILMFGDGGFLESRTETQFSAYADWLDGLGDARLAIIECGAGSAIPTVRRECERLALHREATLIRLNPREPETPTGHIGISAGALEALRAFDARMTTSA